MTTTTYAPRVFTPDTLPKQWQLRHRDGTGQFIVSDFDTLLCRVQTASGLIYLWDKKQNREVAVQIRELFSALFVV